MLQNQQRLEAENRALRGEVDTLRADQSSLRDENGRLRSDDQDRGVETGVNRLVSRMEATALKSAATALTLTGEFRYRTVAAFTGASATGTERLCFTGLDRWVRADWALAGGTTTATYSVSGEAV